VYGSLADIAVSKGQAVSRGQTLGTVGSADPDLPPHLHFEIRPQGRAADPMDWLKEK
jgi:septal ring factor EnvC (AmiA/AmiB activator)